MLVGTDVCVRLVFVWEETRVPRGNPLARLGDHMTWLLLLFCLNMQRIMSNTLL